MSLGVVDPAVGCAILGVAMLTNLDHLILAVDDLDAAVRDYTRLLGRTPSWRGEHPGEGRVNALFRLENTYLELLAPEGDGPGADALRARLDARGEGLVGLVFGASDIEGVHADLEAKGLGPGPVSRGMGRDVDSGAFRRWQTVSLAPETTGGIVVLVIEHETPEAVLPHSGWLAGEDTGVSGLDHVVVQTRDPEAAKTFYQEGLGLRLALDKTFPQWGSRMLFFRVGGVTVEVVASLDPDDAEREGERDRLFGLCWRVAEGERTRSRLADAGLDVSEVRSGRKPGTRVFTLRDGSHGVPTLMLEGEQ